MWEYIRADQYCDSVRDGTHDTPKPTESGYKLVTGKHIKAGQIDSSTAYFISEKDYIAINGRSLVEQWDVLMSMIGTVGESAIVKEPPSYAIKNVALFKCGGSELKGRWLSYYLQSPVGQGHMNGNQKGSSQQFLSLKQLRALPIPVPEKSFMQKAVQILSAYDNLIENNQKQIKLLEEAVQRLYKEWFVDLRFPGYEATPVVDGVPKGWELGRLEDVIEFNPKVFLSKERLKQSVPMTALSTNSMILNTEEFTTTSSNSGSKFQNGDTLLARITPCLENGKTAFVAGVESDEGAVGSTEFIVMRSKGLNPYMVYLLARDDSFRQSAINSMTGSDGRQRAQADKLKALPYLKPTDQITRLFAGYAEPIFLQIQKKNEQKIRLRQARDRLMPKLMSGEIEVKSQRHKGVIP